MDDDKKSAQEMALAEEADDEAEQSLLDLLDDMIDQLEESIAKEKTNDDAS
jgi:hypothetical protein